MKAHTTVMLTSFGRRLLTCLLFGALLCLCACGGGGYDMTVTIDPAEGTQIPADGITSAHIQVTIKKDGDLLNSGNISFSTNLGSLKAVQASGTTDEGDAGNSQLDVPINMGNAAAQLSSLQAGKATVRVEYIDEDTEVVETSVELKIDFKYALSPETAKVATIEFISADPETVKIFNTTAAGQTSTKVTFQVLDKLNQPISNKQVYFSIPKPLGEASIVPLTTKTDINGYAVTYFTAGRVAGVAEIIAGNEVYENRTDDYVAGAAQIHVVAGSANFNNFSFGCVNRSIGGGYIWDGITLSCGAFVADRDYQEIPNQPVLFVAEAGGIIPFVYTTEEGYAETTYTTQDPRPFPTAPDTLVNMTTLGITTLSATSPIGQALAAADDSFTVTSNEVSVTNPSYELDKLFYDSNYWSGLTQLNPRDGLSTLIAITSGEEPLTKDINQNGLCDDGDTFLSIGEPFVDRNDDGIYNEGEYFLDIDNNGVRTDPEDDATHLPYKINSDCSKWKKDTQIWKSYRVVWVGEPQEKFKGFLVIGKSSNAIAETGRLLTKEDSIEIKAGGYVTMSVYALDGRLNSVYGSADTQLSCSYSGQASIDISPAEQSVLGAFGPAPLGVVTISVLKPEKKDDFKGGSGLVTCSWSADNMHPSTTVKFDVGITVVAEWED